MNRLLPICALAIVASLEAGAPPLGVFVAATASPVRERPTEAERQRASAAYGTADSARKELEKSLKAQYGKKRDKWPAEAQEQLAAAEEARYRTNADWLYRTDAEPVTEDWRVAIARALNQSGLTGRKEHITSVSAASQAHLIVTLTAVRNPSAAIDAADDRCAVVRLTNGPKVSAAQFASVPPAYRPTRAKAARLAGPSDQAPFWQFEGCGLHPYFSTEESIANVVNDFVGAHLDLLSDSSRP